MCIGESGNKRVLECENTDSEGEVKGPLLSVLKGTTMET